MNQPTCPKCGCQIEIKLALTSVTKSDAPPAGFSGDIGNLLADAEAQSLNQWEADFIGKLRERYDKYGDRVLLSDKQRGILEKIAAGEK